MPASCPRMMRRRGRWADLSGSPDAHISTTLSEALRDRLIGYVRRRIVSLCITCTPISGIWWVSSSFFNPTSIGWRSVSLPRITDSSSLAGTLGSQVGSLKFCSFILTSKTVVYTIKLYFSIWVNAEHC